MKILTTFTFIAAFLFSKFCWSNELNYKIISNYLTEKGYKDTSDDGIWGCSLMYWILTKTIRTSFLNFQKRAFFMKSVLC